MGFRVLLATHQGQAPGGIGTIARGLAAHLPTVLREDEHLERLPATGGPGPSGVRLLTLRGSATRFAHEQLRLAGAARAVDLVHLCDLRPLVTSRTPFLITVHDVTFLDFPDWMPRSVARYKRTMLATALWKRPAKVLCVSTYTAARLLHHHPELPADRVAVVYPGAEAPAASGPHDAEPARGAPPYFLTVSTIEPRKNHLTLLRAFVRARASGLAAEWWVAGAPGHLSGPVVDELARTPGVRVLGSVSAEELERLYSRALFTALPSHVEGFGFPPLESMARGVAVACSTGSALDEVAGDAALRVAAPDVEGWADALHRLAGDDALRDSLAERGRRQARRFEWRTTAQSVARIYREAIAGGRG